MWYQINSPHIAYEALDGEVFIINTKNGMYFVASGYAAVIWNAIAAGYSLADLQQAFTHGQVFTDNNTILQTYITDLINEELIFIADAAPEKPKDILIIEKQSHLNEPLLTKYSDLQELVTLDPIHDVSINQGWPFQG